MKSNRICALLYSSFTRHAFFFYCFLSLSSSFFSTSLSPHHSLPLSPSPSFFAPSFIILSPPIHSSLLSSVFFPHSPSFCLLAYAVNQNKFPRGTALNIILNFSFLISAASFTLNLLPRAKKQHGIHETCTHHRKCDYSLSISLSTIQDNMGIVKRAHTSDWTTSHSLFHVSCFSHPTLAVLLSLSIPFILFFPLTCLVLCYQSFSPYFNVSFCAFPPPAFHSLMLRGNSLLPLMGFIRHHHHFLSLFLARTHTVCAPIGVHRSGLHISVAASEQYRG